MPQPSFIKQFSGAAAEAIPVQWPIPAETFVLLDPPEPMRSQNLSVHRDCQIFKLAVTATTPGIGDTTFQMLLGEPDNPSDPESTLTFVDIVPGGGILPVGKTYKEWWLTPHVPVSRFTSRIAVNVTDVGFQVTGLIWQFLFV